MEDGDTEKYHPSRVIQDFVFLSRNSGCIRCISLQVYNKGYLWLLLKLPFCSTLKVLYFDI